MVAPVLCDSSARALPLTLIGPELAKTRPEKTAPLPATPIGAGVVQHIHRPDVAPLPDADETYDWFSARFRWPSVRRESTWTACPVLVMALVMVPSRNRAGD